MTRQKLHTHACTLTHVSNVTDGRQRSHRTFNGHIPLGALHKYTYIVHVYFELSWIIALLLCRSSAGAVRCSRSSSNVQCRLRGGLPRDWRVRLCRNEDLSTRTHTHTQVCDRVCMLVYSVQQLSMLKVGISVHFIQLRTRGDLKRPPPENRSIGPTNVCRIITHTRMDAL